jgi:hypothetical protein
MTSHSTIDTDAGETAPGPSEDLGVDHFGSSVYGGRPTFVLVRRDGADGATLTLYELLPEEQATARSERLERSNPTRSLVTESFESVFEDSLGADIERWSWEDWTAVKIRRLSGSRVRAVLPLVRETLEGTDFDDDTVTSEGDSHTFLSETVGVRLALAFLGVKPIQRVDRMRALCRGIARMSNEECYYWHAKCRAPSSPNGKKALRTLLTDHL